MCLGYVLSTALEPVVTIVLAGRQRPDREYFGIFCKLSGQRTPPNVPSPLGVPTPFIHILLSLKFPQLHQSFTPQLRPHCTEKGREIAEMGRCSIGASEGIMMTILHQQQPDPHGLHHPAQGAGYLKYRCPGRFLQCFSFHPYLAPGCIGQYPDKSGSGWYMGWSMLPTWRGDREGYRCLPLYGPG